MRLPEWIKIEKFVNLHNTKQILRSFGLLTVCEEARCPNVDVMRDLRSVGCEIVTIGQYLRPSRLNLPVVDYIRPEIFERLRLVISM